MKSDGDQGRHRRLVHRDQRVDQPGSRARGSRRHRPARRCRGRSTASIRNAGDERRDLLARVRRRQRLRHRLRLRRRPRGRLRGTSSARAGRMARSSGSTDCHGDNYSVAVGGGVVYTASHDHYCGNIGGFPQTDPTWTFHHSLAFAKEYHGNQFDAGPLRLQVVRRASRPARCCTGSPTGRSARTPAIEPGRPGMSRPTTTTSSTAASSSGSTTSPQQGLVRFGEEVRCAGHRRPAVQRCAVPGGAAVAAPGRDAPFVAGQHRPRQQHAHVRAVPPGQGLDSDLDRATADSNFWNRPDMKYVDKTVTAGTTYQYRVRAIDPNGNVATGAGSPRTATDDARLRLRTLRARRRRAALLAARRGERHARRRLGRGRRPHGERRHARRNRSEPRHREQGDRVRRHDVVVRRPRSRSKPAPTSLSIEAWFKTTSTDGGKIVGFGNSSTGNSGSYDRHIYLDGSGRVTFGVLPRRRPHASRAPPATTTVSGTTSSARSVPTA